MSHGRSDSTSTVFDGSPPELDIKEDQETEDEEDQEAEDEYHHEEYSAEIDRDNESTFSITNSVYNYHRENGRTYHGYRAGSYQFPNDASEIERLEYQHILMHHCLGERFIFAPLPTPEALQDRPRYDTHSSSAKASLRMLDIGCGTGTFAIELADLYPSALVEATDLSPIQPSYIPTNVNFIIDDAEQADWAVPQCYYDYIHTRIMLGSFKSYKEVIMRSWMHLKEGAWMESQEVDMMPQCDDGTMTGEWKMKEWSELLIDAAERAERPLTVAKNLKEWYEEAGFVDVQERVFRAPIGGWEQEPRMKELGHWWEENLKLGLQGFTLALLTRGMDWSPEQVEVFLVGVRKSFDEQNVHAYHNVYVVTGRKPTRDEKSRPGRSGQKHGFDSGSPDRGSKKRSPIAPKSRDEEGVVERSEDEARR